MYVNVLPQQDTVVIDSASFALRPSDTSVITSEMIYHRGGKPERAIIADLMSWNTSHG